MVRSGSIKLVFSSTVLLGVWRLTRATLPVGVDRGISIDTIGESLVTRLSLVATPSLRSEFEQQLCGQLLSLSEVVEVLVDRVLELEERLQLLEGQQREAVEGFDNAEETGELLSASELKVRSLRNRLTPATVVPLKPEAVVEESMEAQASDAAVASAETPAEAPSDAEMEYVDDPQIDLMSA